MATWTDTPPTTPLPGTEPRAAWSRLIEAPFPLREPDPSLEHWGPCDRQLEAGA